MSNVAGNFGSLIPFSANATASVESASGFLIGFLCTVSGTLDLYLGSSASGTHVLSALPVGAGNFVPIPASFAATGLFAALSGGAAGSFIAA